MGTEDMALPVGTEWRRVPVTPYRNYEVSSDGEVRRDGRTLTGDVDRYGYRRVSLSYAGIARRFKVHRLVCEAFNGPCPEGFECAHLDGNARNNRAENLAWVSRSENVRHQIQHGTFAGEANVARPGQANPMAKLKTSDVLALREKAARGQSERSLAAEFGISPGHAHKIIAREKWHHVP